MLLGKRPRPPMKRTTSMNEIMFDLNAPAADAPLPDPHNPFTHRPPSVAGDAFQGLDQRSSFPLVSPRTNRRHSADLSQSNFLRSCGLCKRRLVPGRDIYMYRGDTAFCSLECRQQQMSQDERNEKCSVASKKATATSAGAAAKSPKTETVAAV